MCYEWACAADLLLAVRMITCSALAVAHCSSQSGQHADTLVVLVM